MRRKRNKVSMDDPRKGMRFFPVVLILLGLLLLTGTGSWIRDRFFAAGPSLAGPAADPGPRVMMDGEILGTGHRPMVRNGQVWLPAGFLCIFLMAYDQHYVSSTESGSTAEIGWVEAMVQATLEEVPAEKLVLGIPLFSRLWREIDAAGNADVGVVNALGVNTAWQRARENGSEPVWDKESGQYVSRFTNEEGTFAIWLEDWNAVNRKRSACKMKRGGKMRKKHGLR